MTIAAADVVVVTGAAGPRGIHRVVRVVTALLEHGVEGSRILPVVNKAPRGQRIRAEITAAVNTLTQPYTADSGCGGAPVGHGGARRVQHT